MGVDCSVLRYVREAQVFTANYRIVLALTVCFVITACQMTAKLRVGETLGQKAKHQESIPESLHVRIGEP